MWMMLLLPPPLSIIPIVECMDSGMKDVRISDTGRMATRDDTVIETDSIDVTKVTDEGGFHFWDKPLVNYLLHKQSKNVNLEEDLYSRVVTECDSDEDGIPSKRSYIELVNSNTFDRLVLNYLVSQRKDIHDIKCNRTSIRRNK